MTQQQKDAWAGCMKAGGELLAAGDAHMKAGNDRIALGDGRVAQGDEKYQIGNYLAASGYYSMGLPNEGAFQHFLAAWNDFNSAKQCYYNAKLQYVYAWNQTNPP